MGIWLVGICWVTIIIIFDFWSAAHYFHSHHQNHHHHQHHHHNHHHGYPAYSHQSYSHQVGICHNDKGWENDTVKFPPYPYILIGIIMRGVGVWADSTSRTPQTPSKNPKHPQTPQTPFRDPHGTPSTTQKGTGDCQQNGSNLKALLPHPTTDRQG